MKKIIHIILVLTMFVTMINMNNQLAHAEEPITGTSTILNEHYNTNIDSKEESISIFSIHPSFNDIKSAANFIREQLVNRNAKFTIDIISTETNYYALEQKILNEVFKHTGNPKEGDYLQFHFGGANASFTYLPSTSTYTIQFDCVMYTNQQEEAAVDAKVKEVIRQLNLNQKTEYEKILAIYDYITSTVVYDYAYLNDSNYHKQYTAYAALINKTSVCQGYANLFYRLALEVGLDARFIGGRSRGESHAWNIVRLGNVYYNIDSTWDAGLINYQYFMKNQEDFYDHERDGRFDTNDFNKIYPISNKSYFERTYGKTYTSGIFEYQIAYGKAIITKINSNKEEIVIPSKISNYQVQEVATFAIYNNDYIKKLVISEGIKKLGAGAINNCENLKEIYIPSTLELVKGYNPKQTVFSGAEQAFIQLYSLKKVEINKNNKSAIVKDGAIYSYDMSIFYYLPPKSGVKILNLPESIKQIYDSSCDGNQEIEKVTMPDTVEIIGYFAFNQARNLKEINISKNCKVIGQQALSETKIKSVHIPKTMEMIVGPALDIPTLEKITADEDGFYYVKDGILYCDKTLIAYPAKRSDTTFTVPKNVTIINWGAFSFADNLRYVEILENVREIRYRSFYNLKNLKEVYIHPGVVSIDSDAFALSKALRTVTIPSTVQSIGNDIFWRNFDVKAYCEKGSYAEQRLYEIGGMHIGYYDATFPMLDVSTNKWYYNTIKEVYDTKLMTGTSSIKFEPDSSMTRGMVVTVLHRIAGKTTATYQGKFSDVPSKKYCAIAVEWAAQNKVVNGFKNGTFGPDDNITRQDVAVILHNYAKALGLDLSKIKDLSSFKDNKKVSSYAKPALEWATGVGILSGTKDGNLNPKGNATRAECAKMLVEFYKLINQ